MSILANSKRPFDIFAGAATLQKIYNYLVKYSQIAQGSDDLYYREPSSDELGITIKVEPFDRLVPGTIRFTVKVANFRPLSGSVILRESQNRTNIYLYDTEGQLFYADSKKHIYHANIKKIHTSIYQWACQRTIKNSLGIYPSNIGIVTQKEGINWITRLQGGDVFIKCLFIQNRDRVYKYNLAVFDSEGRGTNAVRVPLRNFTREKFKEIEQLTTQHHDRKFFTAQKKRLLLKEYLEHHKFKPTEYMSTNLYGVRITIEGIDIALKADKIFLKIQESDNIALLHKLSMVLLDNQFQKWCENQQADILPVSSTIKLV